MKKAIASFSALFLILSTPAVLAQMPVGVPVAAVMPAGLERIGVVAAAGGQVELTTPGQVGRIAKSGQPVFLGDLVTTDAQGHLQIMLLDETVFTIGPNSAITIDKFVYDPKSSAGEIKASVAKGVFRYVSGKIAAKNPNSVAVKLPTATIGFRGTIVGGSIQPSGQGLLGLLGPGDNNDAGAQTGSFSVEGQGGEQRDVNRTGFGVEVGEDGGVSDVFQLSQDQVNGLTEGLGGSQGGGGGGGGDDQGGELGGDNMGDLSGEDGALTGDMADLTDGLSGVSEGLNDLTTVVAQDKLSNSSTLGLVTTLADMQAVKDVTQSYHFEQLGARLSNSYTYDIYVDINFLESKGQSVAGGNSRIDVYSQPGTLWQTFDLSESQGFTSDASNPFVFSNVAGSEGDKMDVALKLLNEQGGTVGNIEATAVNVDHQVTLKSDSPYPDTVIATGSGKAPRVEDLSPSGGQMGS